ncbi:hypothetical protein MMC06_006836, partial [Schaereria dolodes]|nr:hypothetical protein [Schaereria dolodes]
MSCFALADIDRSKICPSGHECLANGNPDWWSDVRAHIALTSGSKANIIAALFDINKTTKLWEVNTHNNHDKIHEVLKKFRCGYTPDSCTVTAYKKWNEKYKKLAKGHLDLKKLLFRELRTIRSRERIEQIKKDRALAARRGREDNGDSDGETTQMCS